MFQKIKKITEEFRQRDRKILSATLENGWANVYHDSNNKICVFIMTV